MELNKDFLWKGLPAVFYRGKYIVFSPYAKKITCLSKQQLSNKKIFEKLNQQKFFGNPSKRMDNRLTITLYLTPNCNLKCIYCFDACGEYGSCTKKLAEDESMNPKKALEFLKKILKNYNKFNSNKIPKLRIHFFGGEPTLEFDTIKAVVEFLEKEKINVLYQISTNLITSQDRINYMISKNFRFDISCDGPPKINDKQRPFKVKSKLGPTKHVENMIKHLTKNNARIRTKAVIIDNTVKEMPKIVEYLASLGVNHIRLEPFFLDGRAEINELKSVNPDIFLKYFLKAAEKCRELSKKYNRRIYASNWAIRNLLEPRDFFCNISRGDRLAVLPNGTIAKCVRNLHSNETSPFIVGKINKEVKVNNEKIGKLQKHSVGNMSQCKNCFAKYICGGCCPNENLKSSGSLKKPAKNKCEIAKKLIKALIIKMYQKSK